MKEKDKEVVRYNNDLNNKTYLKNFNALELNFFMAICSKIKAQGTSEVIFSFSELKKKIQTRELEKVKLCVCVEGNQDSTNDYYDKKIKEAIKELIPYYEYVINKI